MKNLTLESVIKILILIGFSIFFIYLIASNQILKYVHPRIIPFVILSAILLFFISASLLLFNIKFSTANNVKCRYQKYIIFILPLLITLIVNITSSNSEVKTNNVNIVKSSTSSNSSVSTSKYESPSESSKESDDNGSSSNSTNILSKKSQVTIENNTVKISRSNFVVSLNQITKYGTNYEGKDIDISGFIYKDKNLKLSENQFIIGRFMMVCCTADLQVIGLKCTYGDASSYNSDTWVKIHGKLQKDSNATDGVPLIVVESIEKDSSPDTEYVYPY